MPINSTLLTRLKGQWSTGWESNPHPRLGRTVRYRYATGADKMYLYTSKFSLIISCYAGPREQAKVVFIYTPQSKE